MFHPRTAIALLAAAAASTCSADILGPFSSGIEVLSSPPANVAVGALESSDSFRVFLESQFVVSGGFDVDHAASGLIDSEGALVPAQIADGQRVKSYYIHLDPVDNGGGGATLSGAITFTAEILGVLVLNDSVNDTDGALGAGGTFYDVDGAFELMPDSFEISASRRKITVNATASSSRDRMRVLVANPVETMVHEYQFEGNGIDNVSGADLTLGVNTEFRDHTNGLPFQIGKAMRVQENAGNNGAAHVSASEFFEFGTSDFTIAFTVRRAQADTSDKDTILDAANLGGGWKILFLDGGNVRFNAVGQSYTVDTPGLSLGSSQDDWHHLAFTCDRSEVDGARWYLNGELVTSEDATTLGFIASVVDVWFGRDPNGLNSDSLDGLLGRLQVYNYALPAEHVLAIAREAGGVVEGGCTSDLNGDGQVNGADLASMLSAWGMCP